MGVLEQYRTRFEARQQEEFSLSEYLTLTYTDVHIERLLFFQNLFDRFPGVRWEDTVSRRSASLREDLYHLCLGTYEARDRDDLLAYRFMSQSILDEPDDELRTARIAARNELATRMHPEALARAQ